MKWEDLDVTPWGKLSSPVRSPLAVSVHRPEFLNTVWTLIVSARSKQLQFRGKLGSRRSIHASML